MKVILVCGARPNFMKIAPIMEEMKKHSEIEAILVHTGQHYDDNMSKLFFEDLGIPEPEIYLGVGSGTHAEQTARIMLEIEKVLLKEKTDLVIVVGDVNSAIACALASVKLHIPVAHVEAGLRSFDRTMPEEINRILTDAISDFLFTTEESADENLRREGISYEKIFFVGNTMIDTLLKYRKKAEQSDILYRLGLANRQSNNLTNPINLNNSINVYAVLTLHRPSNVDNNRTFKGILEAIKEVSHHLPIIFAAHPRTLNRIKEFAFENYFNFIQKNSNGLEISNSQQIIHHPPFITRNRLIHPTPYSLPPGIYLTEPHGYLDFLCLMSNAKLVLTDSGGMQEETTILGIPCVTIRENTERPVTVTEGTNVVVGTNKENIITQSVNQLNKVNKLNNPHRIPKLWDGLAAVRIVSILVQKLSN